MKVDDFQAELLQLIEAFQDHLQICPMCIKAIATFDKSNPDRVKRIIAGECKEGVRLAKACDAHLRKNVESAKQMKSDMKQELQKDVARIEGYKFKGGLTDRN